MAAIYDYPAQEDEPAPEFIIQTDNLTKVFGEETAVNNISLKIPRGSIFGFIGPSGSGKTTTVRLLTGIYRPTAGKARVFGHDPMKFTRTEREKIGYMPQLFVLYPDLTVRENLNFAASLYGLGWRGRRRLLPQLLDLVELNGHERKVVRNISGGMQRRLSLAATLVHHPELLFLDEPTAGIDPVLRRKFWDYFEELKGNGRTLFVTTQYVGESAYCDYVGVMAEGRVLMVDTPEGLRRRAFSGDLVDLTLAQPWQDAYVREMRALPFVRRDIIFVDERTVRLVVEEASITIPEMVRWGEERNLPVESINEYMPPFDDVFVQLVEQETADA